MPAEEPLNERIVVITGSAPLAGHVVAAIPAGAIILAALVEGAALFGLVIVILFKFVA